MSSGGSENHLIGAVLGNCLPTDHPETGKDQDVGCFMMTCPESGASVVVGTSTPIDPSGGLCTWM